MRRSSHLDGGPVRSGLLVAAAVAIPAALVGQALDSESPGEGPGWLWVFPAAILAGLTLGAAIAAWGQRRGTPILHGMVVALGVFCAVQAVGVARQALVGDDINWSRITSSLLLTTMAGTLGGILGSSLALRRPPR